MKPMDKLLKCIPTLDPIEFIGLAKTLGVKLLEQAPTDAEHPDKVELAPRSFTDVLADVLDRFEHANRTTKRQILQLVDRRKRSAADPSGTAISETPREDVNASNSENT